MGHGPPSLKDMYSQKFVRYGAKKDIKYYVNVAYEGGRMRYNKGKLKKKILEKQKQKKMFYLSLGVHACI